jgi:LytS/YehU family sensor histidine kinase
MKGQLPPLTLQLLVENAIKHNIVSATKPLKIIIRAEGENLTVSNNLQPKIVPEAGTHTGLSNIRNRYAYLTERKVDILRDSASFTIRLPLLKPDANV